MPLEVISVRGPVFVQDGGRPGWMHQGVPPGGAWVPSLLARANAAVENDPGAAALEAFAEFTVRARGTTVRVAIDDRAHTLGDGETLRIERPEIHRVRYLAVRGGIDVPVRLGGRGTLLVAALGGLDGRMLRAGDVITPGNMPAKSQDSPDSPDLLGAIHIVPGPDLDRFAPDALATLVGASFAISPQSDRVGTRLHGARIERVDSDAGVSTPMVSGAIEIPASGEPIVLGPDHPTTGGYPVVGVILRADQSAFFARRPGASVRFTVAKS